MPQDFNDPTQNYFPVFFTKSEWAFVLAACDRLIPGDSIGPGAIELGVPLFLDRHMQSPYAAGAIWYREGPFFEAGPEFGYQGPLSPREILRAGIASTNAYCRENFDGRVFAQLGHADQERVLGKLEKGEIELGDVPAMHFFSQLLSEVRMGYFADPAHGGNRDMGSWKMIGYPGMRADYRDWIGVREKAYSLPPVDLSSRGDKA
jgi:gluconate 2-dehydrogenase gamma chain